MGSGVALIDSGEATAAALEAVLADKGLAAPEDATPEHRFMVSDDQARFLQVGSRFVGDRLGSAEVVPVG
jgi:glutamate racemase